MPDDFESEEIELRMIDFPNIPMPEGMYTLEIVRIDREDNHLVAYARFVEIKESNGK